MYKFLKGLVSEGEVRRNWKLKGDTGKRLSTFLTMETSLATSQRRDKTLEKGQDSFMSADSEVMAGHQKWEYLADMGRQRPDAGEQSGMVRDCCRFSAQRGA